MTSAKCALKHWLKVPEQGECQHTNRGGASRCKPLPSGMGRLTPLKNKSCFGNLTGCIVVA